MAETEIRQVESTSPSAITRIIKGVENGEGMVNDGNVQDMFNDSNFTSVDADSDSVEDVTDDMENELNEQGSNSGVAINGIHKLQEVSIYGVQPQQSKVTQYPFNKNPRSRSPYNSTPDTAFYLDNTYLNQGLVNLGDSNEDWYCFTGNTGTKVTAIFSQPSTGDYDIYLYQLDAGAGTLSLVALSEYAGSMDEQFSYVIDTTTDYFLRVVPFVPASPAENYDFGIFTSSVFDGAEADDNPWFANVYSSSLDVSQTIDNPYDNDWFEFTTSSSNYWYHEVSLESVPSGATYGFIVYDDALNVVASFTSSNSQTRKWELAKNTTYHLQVLSVFYKMEM